MSPIDIFRTALSSIGANKLRAGLTLLGIVIGVAAVISLMAIGRGAQEAVTSNIESLGTNLLFVRPGETTTGGISAGSALLRRIPFHAGSRCGAGHFCAPDLLCRFRFHVMFMVAGWLALAANLIGRTFVHFVVLPLIFCCFFIVEIF